MEKIYIILLMTIAGTHAQILFFGGCGTVSIKQPFDATAYLGRWYEYSKYFAIFEFGGKCIVAEYGAVNASTISVLNSQISILNGRPQTISGSATLKSTTPPIKGDLTVVFPTAPFPGPYQVLDTDYTSYSVVYGCTGNILNWFSLKFVWILTRYRIPTTATLNKAYAVMDQNKLPRYLLLKTDQVNCCNLSFPYPITC